MFVYFTLKFLVRLSSSVFESPFWVLSSLHMTAKTSSMRSRPEQQNLLTITVRSRARQGPAVKMKGNLFPEFNRWVHMGLLTDFFLVQKRQSIIVCVQVKFLAFLRSWLGVEKSQASPLFDGRQVTNTINHDVHRHVCRRM